MAFPTTSVLDTFTRADEGPPPSASWLSSGWRQASSAEQVVSNACQCTNTSGGGLWGTTVGPDCEVFQTVSVVPADGSDTRLFCRLQQVGSALTVDGYQIAINRRDDLTGFRAEFYRIDNGTSTQLGAADDDSGGIIANGIKFGMEAIGSNISLYVNRSGSWTLSDTRSDATYSAAGTIGTASNDSTARIDGFGGGTVVVPFPTTSVLDDFNRANGAPGANWAGPVFFESSLFSIVSNQADFTGGVAKGGYWVAATEADPEVYLTASTAGQILLYARITSPGTGTSGYYALFTNGVQRNYRIDAGVPTQIGSTAANAFLNGDSCGLEVVADAVNSYTKTSGVWSAAVSTTDATYSARGVIGVTSSDSVVDDFGGGIIPEPQLMLVMGMLGTGRV